MKDSSTTVKHRNIKTGQKQFAIPAAFIGLSIYGTADEGFINHDEISEEHNEYFPAFSNKAYNYLHFEPIPIVYNMDILELKGQHTWQQQTNFF